MRPLILTTLLASSLNIAHAGNWYIGAAIGEGEAEVVGHDRQELVYDALAGAGFNTLATAGSEVDDTDTWKLYAGYRFNEWLSVEGSYLDLGDTDGAFSATLDEPGNPVVSGKLQSEYEALSIAAVAEWRPLNWLGLQGKLGAHYWQHDYKLQGSGVNISDDDSGTGLLYGVGLRLGNWQQLSLRLEWERFDNIEEEDGIDVKSLAVEWQF